MNRVRKVVHGTKGEVFPYTGRSVTVALLDTGIALHPDLDGRLVAFRDFLLGSRRPYDDSGHGTHVAGCLCGSGRCSGGLYRGIAPASRLVVCKVLDEKGEGRIEHMEAGISYIIETRKLYNTRIVNISVGVSNPEEESARQRLLQRLEDAWEAGLLVVVAAGNKGPEPGSLSSMGYSPHVICVGCHEGNISGNGKGGRNACENYSGRGEESSKIRKPDIVSPGTGIISCCASFRRMVGGRVKNAYIAKDGTSMAVPAVSAAAALLWEKYPSLTNEEIRKRLLWGARDLKEPWNKQGWGLLDVKTSLE